MGEENPLWGAPRIHGELLKLGFDVAQSTVLKYMLRRRGPPSQGWKTFLRNHADGIASVDFLIVPTLAFERLFVFVILMVPMARRSLGGFEQWVPAQYIVDQNGKIVFEHAGEGQYDAIERTIQKLLNVNG